MKIRKDIEKNKLLFSLILFSAFIISLSFVSADIILPKSGTNHTGTIDVSCSNPNDQTGIVSARNASVWYNSSGGSARQSRLTTIVNTSDGQVSFNETGISITSLSDLATYNFSCLVANTTTTLWTAGSFGVTLDSTNPTCISSILKENINVLNPNTLECTCTDGVDSALTITRTLTKPTATTVTVTVSPYVASSTDVNEKGLYTWACSGSDYTGNSDTESTLDFIVSSDAPSSKAKDITISQAIKGKDNNLIVLGGVLFVIIIIVLLTIVISSKK